MNWRVGQRLGRTLYRQDGSEPSASDDFLGMMETPELAETVVEAIRRFNAEFKAPAIGETWEPRGNHDQHEDPLEVAEAQMGNYICKVRGGGSSTRRLTILEMNLYYERRKESR